MREHDPKQPDLSVQQATEIALSNASHVFHFSQPSALYNLMEMAGEKYDKACDILKRNGCVRKSDLAGIFNAC